MRYKITVEDDNYIISGNISDLDLDSKFKGKITKNHFKISDKSNAIEIFSDFLHLLDITIEYNFSDYNNFLGKNLLKDLFTLAYTDKQYDSSFIEKIKREINSKKKSLPDSSEYSFPDILISDDFFLDCLDIFESKMKRIKVDFSQFYNLIEDKTGNRKTLRYITKLLFLINYSSTASKSYTSYLLNQISSEEQKKSSPTIVQDYIKQLEMIELYNFLKEDKKEDSKKELENELKKLIKQRDQIKVYIDIDDPTKELIKELEEEDKLARKMNEIRRRVISWKRTDQPMRFTI